ncbi:MAG: beta-lactamase family protein, partial [Candidatus Eremiobacteraeota bacterium]|nr:beta-lactamase family protein [Candidatus Eremiobacteraeota bacterium]
MKKHLFTLFVLISLLAGCGSSRQESFVATGESSKTPAESAFETAVTEIFEARNLPGVAAGLWQPGRPPLLLLLGEADKEAGRPLSLADRFRIGSVTKSFTVTLILQLAEEGVISLDDPIGQYIPGIQNPDATLEQLANMTSGIFNYSEEPLYQQQIVSDFAQPWTNQQLIGFANLNDP